MAEIFNGNRIELKNASNGGALVFENSGGTDKGLLVLDHAASFKGTVAGFATDGTNSDTLDLQDLKSGSLLTWSFRQSTVGTAPTGILTVNDHQGDIANIALIGQYLAAAGATASSGTSFLFQVAPDTITGTTGTLITTTHL